jgi:hypothetical protein|tara:strand:- start:515 stop:868 length:354 start_codon:yes stop_codon:yes gene_type:complete
MFVMWYTRVVKSDTYNSLYIFLFFMAVSMVNMEMSSASNKRPAQNSGSNDNKRQRLSSDTSDSFDSTISEALPETFGGETKESDSDRRGRLKKERKRQREKMIGFDLFFGINRINPN